MLQPTLTTIACNQIKESAIIQYVNTVYNVHSNFISVAYSKICYTVRAQSFCQLY